MRHELDGENVRRVPCGNRSSELEGGATGIRTVGMYIDVLVIATARKKFATFRPARIRQLR